MKKRNKLNIVIAISALSILVGCNDEVQTVDWYKSHEKERQEMLTRCKNNSGELAKTPNCLNAQKADSALTWGARGGIEVKPLTFK